MGQYYCKLRDPPPRFACHLSRENQTLMTREWPLGGEQRERCRVTSTPTLPASTPPGPSPATFGELTRVEKRTRWVPIHPWSATLTSLRHEFSCHPTITHRSSACLARATRVLLRCSEVVARVAALWRTSQAWLTATRRSVRWAGSHRGIS